MFNAHAALELYAEAFEEAGALQHFEAFCSLNGPAFYGLEVSAGLDMLRISRATATSPATDECPEPGHRPHSFGLTR